MRVLQSYWLEYHKSNRAEDLSATRADNPYSSRR